MVLSTYRYVRRKLSEAGLAPQSRLARFTVYLLVVDLTFFVVHRLALLADLNWPSLMALSSWVVLFTIILVVLGAILLMRWARDHMLWRLRNRLIVTYVFIGVIPVLLITSMAGIAGYLASAQFATFLATADMQAEANRLEAANTVLAEHIAGELRSGQPAGRIAQALRDAKLEEQRDVTFWVDGKPYVVTADGAARPPVDFPAWLKDRMRGVVWTPDGLLLRAAIKLANGKTPLVVISSLPVEKPLLDRVAANLGAVTIFSDPRLFTATKPGAAVTYDARVQNPAPRDIHRVGGGTLPEERWQFDPVVSFVTPVSVINWETGERRGERSEKEVGEVPLLSVQTRISMLYARLFQTLGPFAGIIAQGLVILAAFLFIIELLALFVGVRLTRSITRSVAALYEGTQHVNRGELRHRIEVKTRDQLAALETSFNSMAESLERLLLEQKEKQRIQNELAIAQEVQEQLFPKQVRDLETLAVHGLCLPARTVSGDYYDFVPLTRDELAIAVGDISGKGISAALLMATLHSAVRAYALDRTPLAVGQELPAYATVAVGQDDSYSSPGGGSLGGGDRESISPAEWLALLNRQLYHSTPMEKYATLFLGVYDGAARTLRYSNAGHLPPIILSADGAVRRLDVGGTVIGLFSTVRFEQALVRLRPGDIFLAFSDGITEPENEFGEFGEQRLIELVQEIRDLPLDRISEQVTTAVRDWIGGQEQPDDVTLVLARAR
ncbi:MAG TPA: SpoIIE family protein phosphatase [Terriglobales bacterium]|nr:SpoIIE family protein phosphatase [Terriglobales bacterium]